jgi:hypothetical protein
MPYPKAAKPVKKLNIGCKLQRDIGLLDCWTLDVGLRLDKDAIFT